MLKIEEQNTIHLYENFYLRSDSLNYILYCKKYSKENNNLREEILGFYGNMEALKIGLLEYIIKKDINIIKNIENIIKIKNELLNKGE